MKNFTLKVTDVIKNTPDVVTVVFKQPALKKIKYQAGQYLTLIVRINNRKYIRPYSFSSSPAVDQNLEITVKRIPGGVVSNYLYDHVKTGDMIEVIEPMGTFVYNKEKVHQKHIMLWGAGSGITPLLSVLKTVLNQSPEKKVSLFYCNRNPEHTIFYKEIAELQNRFAGKFTVYNFYTRIPEDVYFDFHFAGRIDEANAMKILSKEPAVHELIHYICGPAGLKETVRSALLKLNMTESVVLTEEFEVVIDPEQFDDITTRVVTFRQGSDEKRIEVSKGKSLLEAGLDQLLELSYSCQTGTCLLCKGKLLNGKVKIIGINTLPEGLEADDCLLCCSYPYTDDVELLVNQHI